MNDSIGNKNNNINERKKINNIIVRQNQKIVSILKRFLDYLPASLIKLIFEKNILTNEKLITPLEFKFYSCFIYIDISEINKDYIINKKNINKEYCEYIYSYINKNIEELASILNDYGCDFIFYGTGVLSFIIPDFEEEKFKEKDNSKIFNRMLKMILCALEIRKHFESKKYIKINMGISYGECKFIILDNKGNTNHNEYSIVNKQSFKNIEFIMSEKNNQYIFNINNLFLNTNNNKLHFYYFLLGKCLGDCYKYSKIGEEAQITIDQNIYNYISDYMEVEEVESFERNKLYKVIRQIQSLKLQKNISYISKLNYSDKLIISKKDIILNFSPNFIFRTIGEKGYILNSKLINQNKYMTILMLRPIIRKQNSKEPLKISPLIRIINSILNDLGGLLFKIMYDEKGIIIMIIFGLKKFISKNKDELISIIFAFEVSKKLKEINIYPYIGISSNLVLINLNKLSGGKRDFCILGDAYTEAFQCLEESEKIFSINKSGEDAIIIDKNTMDMIDSIFPCRFIKIIYNKYLCKKIFLFIPLRINKMLNISKGDKIIPLLGSHLHYLSNNSIPEEDLKIIEDKKYLNFYDKAQITHFVTLLKNILENNNKIKIININGLSGSGKTLFLSLSINTFFRQYSILKELLYYNNVKNDYPFVFYANLPLIIYSKSFNEYSKKEFKSIQHILRDIFDYLCEEVNEKLKIFNLFKKNNCLEYLNFLGKFFCNSELKFHFEKNLPEDKTNLSLIEEEDKNNIFSLFIDIFNEYSKYINIAYKDKVKQYNIKIPIIIIIESINICDKFTLEFLKYYLTYNFDFNSNFVLFITTNSIPLFPQYIYQQKSVCNPFYKFKSNSFLYQYEISTLNSKEKMNSFIINFFNEKKNILIEEISEKITNFLIFKTYGGIQDQVIRLLIYLFDNKYIYIEKIDETLTLKENEEFSIMLKQNDFIDLLLPYSIEKNINNIINNELNTEETTLLKICAVVGDLFDTVKLSTILKNNTYSFINSFNDYWTRINNCSSEEFDLYGSILNLEQKNVIEILSDIQDNHKFVVCKFSIPFMREILYQCTSLDQRNELHYIIGRIIKNKIDMKSDFVIYKYYNDELELSFLKNHLRKMEIFMHDYNTGKISKYEESTKNKNEENFSLNNLKTIITIEISNKLSKTKNDKNTLIRSGYLEKKSDGKITWEKRFFILTPNKLAYYYTEADYASNIDSLGFFYLRNLYDVKVLRNDGKYIFCLTVKEWIKKTELMDARIYILSTDNWEDLYIWTMHLKILRIKAFYDNFCANYSFVYFPLFNIGAEKEKSELREYVFKLNLNDNSMDIDEAIKKRIGLHDKAYGRKHSILNNILGLSLKESNSIKKRTSHLYMEILFIYFRFIFRYGFSSFLNNIQIKLSNKKTALKTGEFDFKESSFFDDKYQTEIRNHLNKININYVNLKMKIEEEKKNILIYSEKANKYMFENCKEYLQKYYPIKKYDQTILYKVKDLKKIADYNTIISNKNYDDIEFMEEQEPYVNKEDNLRLGDYMDITTPYPVNKFNSNNNIFNFNNDDTSKKFKKSFVIEFKGDETSNKRFEKRLTENKQTSFFSIGNEVAISKKGSSNFVYRNNTNFTKDNQNKIIKKISTKKSNYSEISKENVLYSIKEESNHFNTQKNKSKKNFSSSDSNSSSFNSSLDKNNNYKNENTSGDKLYNKIEQIKLEFSHKDSNPETEKNIEGKNTELENTSKSDFNFGTLLRKYTNEINTKKFKISNRRKPVHFDIDNYSNENGDNNDNNDDKEEIKNENKSKHSNKLDNNNKENISKKEKIRNIFQSKTDIQQQIIDKIFSNKGSSSNTSKEDSLDIKKKTNEIDKSKNNRININDIKEDNSSSSSSISNIKKTESNISNINNNIKSLGSSSSSSISNIKNTQSKNSKYNNEIKKEENNDSSNISGNIKKTESNISNINNNSSNISGNIKKTESNISNINNDSSNISSNIKKTESNISNINNNSSNISIIKKTESNISNSNINNNIIKIGSSSSSSTRNIKKPKNNISNISNNKKEGNNNSNNFSNINKIEGNITNSKINNNIIQIGSSSSSSSTNIKKVGSSNKINNKKRSRSSSSSKSSILKNTENNKDNDGKRLEKSSLNKNNNIKIIGNIKSNQQINNNNKDKISIAYNSNNNSFQNIIFKNSKESKPNKNEEKISKKENINKTEEKISIKEENISKIKEKESKKEENINKIEEKLNKIEEKINIIEKKTNKKEEMGNKKEEKANKKEEMGNKLEEIINKFEEKINIIEEKIHIIEENKNQKEEKINKKEEKKNKIGKKSNQYEKKSNKNEKKSNKIEGKIFEKPELNEIISLNSDEEEPTAGKINLSISKLNLNNYFTKKGSNKYKNNISLYKKNKNEYNPYIISFFSKAKKLQANPSSNVPSTERTNSLSDRNEPYLKANKNLKLWLMLNKNKEISDNNKETSNSLNKTDRNESSRKYIIESLNESYSYIKQFIFDNNYRDTKKRCQLKKKVLVELKPKNNNNNKKYKNDSHSEMIQKLESKSVSLDQEKEYIGCLKDLLHNKSKRKIMEYNKVNSNTTRSKSSYNYESSTSNNTYREKFYYPKEYYLNENDKLHKKTHVSYLFSKLRANNKLK